METMKKIKSKVKEFEKNINKVYSVKEVTNIMTKGKPKQDGSGRGVRANKGRGGCSETEEVGKGRNRNK